MKGWIFILIGLPLMIIPPIGIIFIIMGILALIFPGAKNAPDRGFLKESAGYQYVHSYDNTGIAYDPSTRRLKLMSVFKRQRVTREYDLTQVRGYDSQRHNGGEIVGTGVQVAGANRRVAHENRMASGVFVNVKDVDYPKWRIAFNQKDQTSQDRWSEILNQAFESD